MQNHNLIFKFPSGTRQVAAQLALTAGSCTVLAGKNGSGKTTVLRALAGALAPEGGDLSLVRPVLAFTDIERQMHLRMTAVENLQYLSALFGQPVRRREARDALLRVGLDDQADLLAARQSKGQKKRLVMAMICVAPWGTVLLDEPTNGLDREGIDQFLVIAREAMSRHTTVVLTSHEPRVLRELADNVLIHHSNGAFISADVAALKMTELFVITFRDGSVTETSGDQIVQTITALGSDITRLETRGMKIEPV